MRMRGARPGCRRRKPRRRQRQSPNSACRRESGEASTVRNEHGETKARNQKADRRASVMEGKLRKIGMRIGVSGALTRGREQGWEKGVMEQAAIRACKIGRTRMYVGTHMRSGVRRGTDAQDRTRATGDAHARRRADAHARTHARAHARAHARTHARTGARARGHSPTC
eukprot:1577987-Pleurochrysis_carterae.AAC.1